MAFLNSYEMTQNPPYDLYISNIIINDSCDIENLSISFPLFQRVDWIYDFEYASRA